MGNSTTSLLRCSFWLTVGIVILWLCFGIPPVATAQGPDDAETTVAAKEAHQEKPPESATKEVPEETLPDTTASGDVSGELKEVEKAAETEGRLAKKQSTAFEKWSQWKKALKERSGLSFAVIYTALYQRAGSGKGPDQAAGGSLDIIGKWYLSGEREQNTGFLGFALDSRHKFTSVPPSDFGDGIGSQWDTVDGFNTRDLALKQLWWEQHFFQDNMIITAGKVDPSVYYEQNRLSNANEFFLNQAFSFNPTTGQPDPGLGANVLARAGSFYVSGGLHDANGCADCSGFDTIGRGEFFYEAQLGFTPEFENMGPGFYRIAFWYRDEAVKELTPSGSGIAVSLDQDLRISDEQRLVGFLRYGFQDDNITPTRQLVAGGAALKGLFGYAEDIVGIAFAWGEPGDQMLRDQYVGEVFYRMQFSPRLRLTPSYQLILDPTLDPARDSINLFSLRMRLVF